MTRVNGGETATTLRNHTTNTSHTERGRKKTQKKNKKQNISLPSGEAAVVDEEKETFHFPSQTDEYTHKYIYILSIYIHTHRSSFSHKSSTLSCFSFSGSRTPSSSRLPPSLVLHPVSRRPPHHRFREYRSTFSRTVFSADQRRREKKSSDGLHTRESRGWGLGSSIRFWEGVVYSEKSLLLTNGRLARLRGEGKATYTPNRIFESAGISIISFFSFPTRFKLPSPPRHQTPIFPFAGSSEHTLSKSQQPPDIRRESGKKIFDEERKAKIIDKIIFRVPGSKRVSREYFIGRVFGRLKKKIVLFALLLVLEELILNYFECCDFKNIPMLQF